MEEGERKNEDEARIEQGQDTPKAMRSGGLGKEGWERGKLRMR